MPKIARVIYNRLDQGEPLGIDATSRYEAVLAGRDRNDVDFESRLALQHPAQRRPAADADRRSRGELRSRRR